MCLLGRGCGALAAMTHHTSELLSGVGNDGVLAVRLQTNIPEARFFQSNMATAAAIGDAQFGMPDLLDPRLEMALQGDSIAARADHPQVALLIVTPLTEVVFRRCDSQQRQQNRAD